MEKVKKNDVIKVKVTGVQKYGAFVNSEDNNYDGLIHISLILSFNWLSLSLTSTTSA